DAGGFQVDLQAAGGLETANCVEVCQAGARSLPLGNALHRESDMAAYIAMLRNQIEVSVVLPHPGPLPAGERDLSTSSAAILSASTLRKSEGHSPSPEGEGRGEGKQAEAPIGDHHVENKSQTVPRGSWNVLIVSRAFGKQGPEILDRMEAAGCIFMPHSFEKAPTEQELLQLVGNVDVIVSGTEPLTAKVIAAAPRLKII